MSRTVITCRRSSDNASCDIDIGVGSNIVTVRDLAEKVRSGLEIPSTRFLRLITKGKLIQPESAQVADFNLENGSFVHCVVTDSQPNVANANTRCSSITSGQSPRGGLDELTRSGLEIDEIVALRLTFSEEIERFRRRRRLEMRHGEEEEHFTNRVETQWILSQHTNSDFWNGLPEFNRYWRAIRAQITEHQERGRLIDGSSSDETDGDGSDDDVGRDSFTSQIMSLFSSQQGYRRLNEQEMTSLGRYGGVHARTGAQPAEGEGGDDDYDVELARSHTGDHDRSATGSMRMDRSPIPVEDQMGTAKDYCWGVMLGTAFGTLMLLCIFDRNMNHRNKMGILLGISMQLLFSIANNRFSSHGEG